MRGDILRDVISRAYGRAAVSVGDWCDAYRPVSTIDPLHLRNRYMLLQAAFTTPRPESNRPVGYGMATWWGVFDSAYTRPGDYIVRRESRPGAADGGTWFIAAQQPLLPMLCVRTTRMVSFTRATTTTTSGVGTYGGYTRANANTLFTDFPASVLNADIVGIDPTDLPADAIPESWQVLLPARPEVVLLTGDVMADDLGRTGVISSAELTDLGWRLLVKVTTT
jgi:hypothetical protein